MIVIEGNPISEYYRDYVIESWRKRDYEVEYFDAVTPETMHRYDYLKFGLKRDTIEFTDTEKAVWYSHAELWAKCRNNGRPMMVVEHDIKLLDKIPESVYDNDIAGLSFTMHGERRAKLAGGCYYITPETAKSMLDTCKRLDKVIYNSDSIIHHYINKRGMWYQYCEQYQNEEVGVTVQHNKE